MDPLVLLILRAHQTTADQHAMHRRPRRRLAMPESLQLERDPVTALSESVTRHYVPVAITAGALQAGDHAQSGHRSTKQHPHRVNAPGDSGR